MIVNKWRKFSSFVIYSYLKESVFRTVKWDAR